MWGDVRGRGGLGGRVVSALVICEWLGGVLGAWEWAVVSLVLE